MLQKKSSSHCDWNAEIPPIVHEVLRSPGQPLDKETRNYFEPRFGHDFSQVRVHTDKKAADSARAVNARAYTIGCHIGFGKDEYSSRTTFGRRLLAHELAHVRQQSDTSSMVANGKVDNSATTEQEAEDAAVSILSGHPARLNSGRTRTGLQRVAIPGETDIAKMPLEEAVRHVTEMPTNQAMSILKRYQRAVITSITTGEGRIRELMSLRAESFTSYLIGGTIEIFGLTSLPSDTWQEPWKYIGAAYGTIRNGQVKESLGHLGAAVKATAKHWQELNDYLDKTDKGAERSIAALRGLEVAGAVAATIATGGAAAGAGAGLLGVSAAVGGVGGVYGATQEFAEQGGEMLAGMRTAIDIAPILRRGATDAITNFVGALAGGALSRYATRLFGSYLSNVGDDVLKELGQQFGFRGPLPRDFFLTRGQRLIADFLGGIGSTPLTTAVSQVVNRVTGGGPLPSGDKFIHMVIEEMVRGGIMQIFLGTLLHGRAPGKTSGSRRPPQSSSRQAPTRAAAEPIAAPKPAESALLPKTPTTSSAPIQEIGPSPARKVYVEGELKTITSRPEVMYGTRSGVKPEASAVPSKPPTMETPSIKSEPLVSASEDIAAIISETTEGTGTASRSPSDVAEQSRLTTEMSDQGYEPPIAPEDRPAGGLFERTANEREQMTARRERGITFNTEREPAYQHNEVEIDSPWAEEKGKRYRLDSYVPDKEIVSRKYPEGGEIDPDLAIQNIEELINKYPPGTRIANTPKNRRAGLAGKTLRGQPILEVPVLLNDVPKIVLDFAKRVGVVIRDSEGGVYR